MASILHSREGVIQGGPLAMFTYELELLRLIKNLKTAHPDIKLSWYDDNTGMIDTFGNIEDYFNSLTQVGPDCSYYPEI